MPIPSNSPRFPGSALSIELHDGQVQSGSLKALAVLSANAEMHKAALSAAIDAKNGVTFCMALQALAGEADSAGAVKVVKVCLEAIRFAQELFAGLRPGLVVALFQELQRARARAGDVVSATTNSAPLRQFTAAYDTSTSGSRVAGYRSLAIQARLDQLDSFDWLFPCDRYTAANSDAPALSRDESSLLLEIPLIGASVWRNYTELLDASNLCVHHHGYVFPGGRPTNEVSLRSPATVNAYARVVRCLHLAGFSGRSESDYSDPRGYSHAKGLQLRLEEDHSRLNPGVKVPTAWSEALG